MLWSYDHILQTRCVCETRMSTAVTTSKMALTHWLIYSCRSYAHWGLAVYQVWRIWVEEHSSVESCKLCWKHIYRLPMCKAIYPTSSKESLKRFTCLITCIWVPFAPSAEDDLLLVKYRQTPFGDFRGEVKNISVNQRSLRSSLLVCPPPPTNLSTFWIFIIFCSAVTVAVEKLKIPQREYLRVCLQLDKICKTFIKNKMCAMTMVADLCHFVFSLFRGDITKAP